MEKLVDFTTPDLWRCFSLQTVNHKLLPFCFFLGGGAKVLKSELLSCETLLPNILNVCYWLQHLFCQLQSLLHFLFEDNLVVVWFAGLSNWL